MSLSNWQKWTGCCAYARVMYVQAASSIGGLQVRSVTRARNDNFPSYAKITIHRPQQKPSMDGPDRCLAPFLVGVSFF